MNAPFLFTSNWYMITLARTADNRVVKLLGKYIVPAHDLLAHLDAHSVPWSDWMPKRNPDYFRYGTTLVRWDPLF